GEDLPHVSHFFAEAHPYWQQRVVVIGGGNSAVEAALEVHRVGARVTLVHFQGEFDRGVKPWILPDVTNRVKDGSIAVRWCSRVIETPRSVTRTCGRCHPPAAGLSRSLRPLGFAPRRRRRFALNRDVPASTGGKNGAPGVSDIKASFRLCGYHKIMLQNAVFNA